MKKLFCLMLILSMTFILLLTFTSCEEKVADVASADELHKATKDGSVKVTQHAGGTSYDYNGDKTSINITADFTIDASHDFFTAQLGDNVPGRILQDAVIEGNGHTITVTGKADGSLGRYNCGLFGRLDNCEVRNLNIVYDLDLKIDGSHGAKFGGLSADALGSKIENCTVTFAKGLSVGFMTDKNGYHDSAFGGLIGKTAQSTIKNCKVKADIYGTAGFMGGVVAYTYSNTNLYDCEFEGSLRTVYLEESFIGGLVGYAAGEVATSRVFIDKFSMVAEPQAWRARTSSVGCLVGKLEGNLHDAYVEFNKDGSFSLESKKNGTFSTTLHGGMAVGEATKSAKVNNIYVDASSDAVCNMVLAENPHEGYLGISKNQSPNVSGIYFVEDTLLSKLNGTAPLSCYDEAKKGYAFEVSGVPCFVSFEYHVNENGDHIYDSATVTYGEESVNLGPDQDNSPFIIKMHAGNLDGWDYGVNYNEHDQKITVYKERAYSTDGSAIICHDYKDINFGDTLWSYDATTGKPMLKAFQK